MNNTYVNAEVTVSHNIYLSYCPPPIMSNKDPIYIWLEPAGAIHSR